MFIHRLTYSAKLWPRSLCFVQASCCPILVCAHGRKTPSEKREATRSGSCVCVFARVGVHVSVWWGVGGHYPKYFKCVVFALQREMHHLHSFRMLFFFL